MQIVPGDFENSDVCALLQAHVDDMIANSPPGHAYVLDSEGLKAPNISFWTLWDDDALIACGAMKELDHETGEIKSMRTHQNHLRKGAAAKLLRHIISVAKERGYQRICLETGRGPYYAAAINLYRTYGFEEAAAFGDYMAGDFNQFFQLEL